MKNALPPSPFVFLSYAHEDQTFALHLKTSLESYGINIWIDQEGIRFGTEDWETTIRETMKAAYVVLLIVSPFAHASSYVRAELRLANLYKRYVYPVWIAGEDWLDVIPLIHLSGTQYIDARSTAYETVVTTIVVAFKEAFQEELQTSTERSKPNFAPRNPYKGLQAFGQQDARDFFGREHLVNDLLQVTKEAIEPHKLASQYSSLIAVIGPSGLGKSSVVLAGLLPLLRSGALPRSDMWIYLKPMLPGAHPVEALMLSLMDVLPEKSMKVVSDDLEDKGARGLYRYASQLAKSPEVYVVLVVDQFEELFTQTTSESERRHFIDLLVNAVNNARCPLIAIITMRADFSDRPMFYTELSQLIEIHRRLVLPMELHDLRSVIEKPAALADVQLTFEKDLVGDLLFEMSGQVGALPLLQFTLEQLFQMREDHLLTISAYQEMGGIRGALSKHAEAIYTTLPSEIHRKLTRALFIRLIDFGTLEQDMTRRRATLSEFVLTDPVKTSILQKTIETFVDERLLTTNESVGTTTVEVSHEALIREWPRLSQWVSESREDIRIQQSVSKDTYEWFQYKKATDRLYRGSQLKDAKAWASRNIPSIQEAEFLRSSTLRQLRATIIVVALFSLFISITGTAIWLGLHQSPDPTYVTNAADDGIGSLRWAVANANSNSTIRFAPNMNGQTILLSSGNLAINKSLTIYGPENRSISISDIFIGEKGNPTQPANIGDEIIIPSAISVTIDNLRFMQGHTSDGFITNEGTLQLNTCIITNNTGLSGVYNDKGTLIVTKSIITKNIGGGITNFGGNVKLSNSSVDGNTSTSGGGIHNEKGTFTLSNSTISGNIASIDGGGVSNVDGSTFIIQNSTISNNKSGGYDTYSTSTGAGIFSSISTLTLSNSTISDNSEVATGGGIAVEGGRVTITFCTISNNISSDAGGVAIEDAYAVHISVEDIGQVEMRNSIVAENRATKNTDIAGNLTTYGYNLIQNTAGTHFSDPLHRHSSDILGIMFTNLGVDAILQENGGQTKTHALLRGSPAIDKIPLDMCLIDNISTDQRGVKRPQGAACDVGAYEYIS